MSIRIEPSSLADAASAFDSGILIVHHPERGTRVMTVDPIFESDGTARIRGLGESVIAADPRVTIVWQPRIRHGWTLICDGQVRPDSPRLVPGAGTDDELIIEPVSGMLHRPHSHADGPDWDEQKASALAE